MTGLLFGVPVTCGGTSPDTDEDAPSMRGDANTSLRGDLTTASASVSNLEMLLGVAVRVLGMPSS